MLDWFLIFAPILLLPIVALLRFVGCNQAFGLNEVTVIADSADVNCGGPAIDNFEADTEDGGTTGVAFTSNGGNHFTQTDSTAARGDLSSGLLRAVRVQ
jgi:hypothetical protein